MGNSNFVICWLLLSISFVVVVETIELTINVDGINHIISADSTAQVDLVAKSFVVNNKMQGGSCDELPTRERTRRCQQSLISNALNLQLVQRALEEWRYTSTINSSNWNAKTFFSGKTYSRKIEMLFRDIAMNPDYTDDATSLLKYMIKVFPEAVELSNLTLSYIQSSLYPIPPQTVDGSEIIPNSDTLCAVTVATEMKPLLKLLDSTLRGLGLPLYILGLGEQWLGHGMKLKLFSDFLELEQKKTIHCSEVLFLDAYDILVMFNTSISMIRSRFHSFNTGILFNGEVACTPDPSTAPQFTQSQNDPMPFLNSGAFIGKFDVVLKMVREVFEDLEDKFFQYTIEDKEWIYTRKKVMMQADDQRLYSRWFLKNQNIARIDSSGILFHSLHEFLEEDFITFTDHSQTVVWSKVTQTAPLIFHGNGNGCSVLLALLKNLQKIGDDGKSMAQYDDVNCNWPFNTF